MSLFDTEIVENDFHIAIITCTKGYLISAIQEQFRASDIESTIVHDMADMDKLGKNILGYLVFLEENILSDKQFQVYIRDKATEEGYPIFVVGDEQEIVDFKRTTPAHLIGCEFTRPVNVRDMVTELNKYLETHEVNNQKIILAVDDSAVMLNSIKNWLGDKYQVILADSGVAAIKYITMKRPDLIILDYEMPIVDGKQTLAMIRSEMDFADIPVIFLTGRQDKESIMEVMAYKPAGYLLKSMKPYAVHKYIDDFFAKQEAQQKAESLRKLIN